MYCDYVQIWKISESVNLNEIECLFIINFAQLNLNAFELSQVSNSKPAIPIMLYYLINDGTQLRSRPTIAYLQMCMSECFI